MNTRPRCPATALLLGATNCAIVLALLVFAPGASHGAGTAPGVLAINFPPRPPTNLTPAKRKWRCFAHTSIDGVGVQRS